MRKLITIVGALVLGAGVSGCRLVREAVSGWCCWLSYEVGAATGATRFHAQSWQRVTHSGAEAPFS